MAQRSTYWPPAEWPETTMALRLGKKSFFASLRRISSVKSNDVNFSLLVAVPPERQLSPAQLQLTSLGANWSRQLPVLEARRAADGVVEGAGQKGGGKGGAEIVVGVAAGAVDDDEGARDLGIGNVERVGTVDHGTRGSGGESQPFGTVGDGGARGGPSGGSDETQGKQLHWRLGYNVSGGTWHRQAWITGQEDRRTRRVPRPVLL